MDHDRSTANKAASGLSKTVGRMNDRTKVILVKATGEGPQKVRKPRNTLRSTITLLYAAFRASFFVRHHGAACRRLRFLEHLF